MWERYSLIWLFEGIDSNFYYSLGRRTYFFPLSQMRDLLTYYCRKDSPILTLKWETLWLVTIWTSDHSNYAMWEGIFATCESNNAWTILSNSQMNQGSYSFKHSFWMGMQAPWRNFLSSEIGLHRKLAKPHNNGEWTKVNLLNSWWNPRWMP